MPEIPKALTELGVAVVIIFIVALIIWLILQIIKVVKKNSRIPAEVFLNGSKRTPCIQSPIVQTLSANQIVIEEAIKEIKLSTSELSKNSILQTELLKRVAAVQEDIGKCIIRMEARDEARPG